MGDPTSSQSTTDVAKERAADVGSTAKHSAQNVAGTAADEAGKVASEVTSQARNLANEARSSAIEQTNAQRDRAVGGLRSLSDELSGMADKSDQGGLGAELARQTSERLGQVAEFLDGREPGDLLEEVRTFARRRPGTFLLGAAAAGLLAGRVTRGAVSAARSEDSSGDGVGSGNGVGSGYPAGGYVNEYDAAIGPAVPVTAPTPGPYTTAVEPGPYETTHGIDATGAREPTAGPLAGGGYEGRP